MTRPDINITPLIDVLLVLLIIFMVTAPLKPSSFKVKVPAESQAEQPVTPNPDTLIVFIGTSAELSLNLESDLGRVNDPQKLIDRLSIIFRQRESNYGTGSLSVPKGVFIKAPKDIDYGSVARVVDAVKLSGADPIALQIDEIPARRP